MCCIKNYAGWYDFKCPKLTVDGKQAQASKSGRVIGRRPVSLRAFASLHQGSCWQCVKQVEAEMQSAGDSHQQDQVCFQGAVARFQDWGPMPFEIFSSPLAQGADVILEHCGETTSLPVIFHVDDQSDDLQDSIHSYIVTTTTTFVMSLFIPLKCRLYRLQLPMDYLLPFCYELFIWTVLDYAFDIVEIFNNQKFLIYSLLNEH